MDRELVGKRPNFRPERKGASFLRVLIWLALILVFLWVFLSLQRGEMISPLQPTATPTRMAESYFLEAQAYFDAGKLDDPSNEVPGVDVPPINDAIDAYQAALSRDPSNAQAWADLARIQVYSTNMLPNDTARMQRLEDALFSANKAVELLPDDSMVHAVRAFVLDWYAFNPLVPVDRTTELLNEAEREASRAIQLDPDNALGLAFYAEILADQSKWLQAEKYASQAVERDPGSMDAHRVYAYVLETLGQYKAAIEQYQQAVDIAPNMTFIYVRIGVNFREGIKNPDRALEFFDRAAKINSQLGVQNPLPYIEIARTYTQLGQFLAASVNAEKALQLDNRNAHTYGQLGIIFRRARNYEGAMPLLKCAVVGCTVEENEMGGMAVQGLPLSSKTVAYYYVEYGTNLAFLSRPNENYCPQALPVLAQVRAAYPDDATLVEIVNDSEGICRRLQSGSQGAQVTPTPLPGNMLTPTPTPGI